MAGFAHMSCLKRFGRFHRMLHKERSGPDLTCRGEVRASLIEILIILRQFLVIMTVTLENMCRLALGGKGARGEEGGWDWAPFAGDDNVMLSVAVSLRQVSGGSTCRPIRRYFDCLARAMECAVLTNAT